MPEDLTVMVTDAGARGHVLSEAYERSPRVKKIVVAPGNDFVGYKRQKEVVVAKDCSLKDPASLVAVARQHGVDFIDVAQDDALALGTIDLAQQEGFLTFGADRIAAELESSKGWSRQFMRAHDIPHPRFRFFDSPYGDIHAHAYVDQLYDENQYLRIYVKADGLCAGKGALDADSREIAHKRIDQMKSFGDAGKSFLVEDALVNSDGTPGEEFSYFAISDGFTYKSLKSANDNKRVYDGDMGDQTGGMGGNSPAFVTFDIKKQIEEQLIAKAIDGMRSGTTPFQGILYVGGIRIDGKPSVIEYNVRFGDPEAQLIVPGIENYAEAALAAAVGELGEIDIRQGSLARVCVVGASKGYPNDYSAAKGKRIYGLEEVMKLPNVRLYSASIAVQDDKFYASGGRLFSVVGEVGNIAEAHAAAYDAIECISIEGDNLHFRKDIARRDLERLKAAPRVWSGQR